MNSVTEKPWGSFEILQSGKKFLVKKIFVNQAVFYLYKVMNIDLSIGL